ncbi:uncharacterized protein LOC123429331 isoform X1 [Hordeum vulgare subsp. vulgare]|uniref:uncharacterized protein LOC123429331 isoform X1 n=1 Tax=Hordeum vulgare subsp. vulgare TaxID=112509 RepID=UPI001D1A3BDF|nr:uncharacterized protein LOC123429331 isoform X1 [Hordeum vulgare subsp. vulgare]
MGKMRVAVVGAGVSGLAAAHELARSGGASVTLYEQEEHLGGSACRTVAVDGVHLDLGFLLFNRVTCPNMVDWLEGLGVEMERSDISMSASTQLASGGRCEWGGGGVSGLLAQRSNALSPSFWRMVREVFRLKTDALRYLEDHEGNLDLERSETLRQFVKSHGYSQFFQEAYLIPVCACLWSCPSQDILGFPAFFVLSCLRDHHLLELFGRPQWLTVKDGSQSFVNKVTGELESMGCRIKTSCQVKSVSCFDGGNYCRVLQADDSEEAYDRIVLCVAAPGALKLLGAEATQQELRILGAFHYVCSDIYLHRDESFMPLNLSAWSALNYLKTSSGGTSATYWLNLLQIIESAGTPYLVTLNPSNVPDHVLLKWNASHLVPSIAAAKASLELHCVQGNRGIWFCGAYQGYGLHEDGVKAGKATAQGLLGKQSILLSNPKQMVPSWTEAGARILVARFLNQFITLGNLILLEEGGTVFNFGKAGPKCHVKCVLQIHDPLFYWKVATEADLGFADAYINGYFSFVDKRDGLLNLFLIFISNRDAHKRCVSVSSKRGWWTPLLVTAGVASAKYFLRHVSRKNTVAQTRQNISQHYDLSNDFFSLFLDPTMTYSCAIFKVNNESFEEAQLHKVGLLIDKANVERNHHVLEIGSGWGTLAIEVVKQTGCKYTGITLSVEQLKYAKRKVKEAGLEDHITFFLCDYRQVPTDVKYDRIISCEMIEAVGHEYMDEFFGCCEFLLAQDGILVLQFTSIPEERYDQYRRSSDFIKEYIFPGCCIPSLARVTSAMAATSRLSIEWVENIGDHYYPTLMHWKGNFMENKDKILALGFDDKFIRIWEYYFVYCMAGFKTRTLGNYLIVFSRPGNDKLERTHAMKEA